MRSCGLSKYKARAIIELNDKMNADQITEEYLSQLPYESLLEEITSLWGFGKWSADMAAIFYFNCADVWSEGDVSLSKALKHYSSGDIRHEKRILELAQPYRSYLCLHLWRAVDNDALK